MVAETTGHSGASMRLGISGMSKQDRGRLSIWVWLLIIGLIIPLFVHVGPLRLSVYRVALVAGFFPAIFLWLSRRAGPVRLPDICVVVICLWSALSMAVMDGGLGTNIEAIGILWVETLGAYLLGRCYIRTPEAFFALTRLLFRLGLLLVPFALYELFSGKNLFLRSLGMIGSVYWENTQEGRLGLERVQGPFAHPIHFGVFFGALAGMFYFVLGYGQSWLNRVRNVVFAFFLCFCSLSSGPILAATSQIIFLFWDGIMKSVRNRWYIFVGLALLAFIVVDLISNRTPFHVAISYLALNEGTAYNRIRIWEFGTRSIWANPLFGIGLTGNWSRPSWMVGSADMFWIVPAMRHGIVVWITYLTLFFSIFLGVIYRQGFGERLQWYRFGYICSMTGLFIVGWTVHFWDALFVFFIFLLASGIWMLDFQDDGGAQDGLTDTDVRDRAYIPYTRFSKRSSASDGPAKNRYRTLRAKG